MTREPGWLSGSWLVRQLGRSWLLGRVGSLYFDDPDLVGGDDTATPSVDTGLGEPTAAELDGHSTGRYSVAWENGDTEVLTENQLLRCDDHDFLPVERETRRPVLARSIRLTADGRSQSYDDVGFVIKKNAKSFWVRNRAWHKPDPSAKLDPRRGSVERR